MKIETHQSLQDTVKAVLMGNFIALNAYIRKEGSISLSFHFKKREDMSKEMKNIRTEASEIENKNQQGKISETKSRFSENVDEVGESLTRLMRKR